MKKWIFSVLACALLAAQSEACGLRVLTEDLPPYQVVNNHQVVAGSAYLQVQAILRSAGLPCRTEVLPWARSFELARCQTNTLIYSLARLPAREDFFIWLTPLIQADYRYFSADHKVQQTQFFASRQVIRKIQLYLAAHPQTDPELLDQLRTAIEQQASQGLPVNVTE